MPMTIPVSAETIMPAPTSFGTKSVDGNDWGSTQTLVAAGTNVNGLFISAIDLTNSTVDGPIVCMRRPGMVRNMHVPAGVAVTVSKSGGNVQVLAGANIVAENANTGISGGVFVGGTITVGTANNTFRYTYKAK